MHLKASSDRDNEMGAKKIPRASKKTKKLPGTKLDPQKIPCQISKP